MNLRFKRLSALVFSLIFTLDSSAAFAMARFPSEEPVLQRNESASVESQTMNFEKFIEISLRRSEAVKSSREEIKIARARTLQALGDAIGDGDFVITNTYQEEQAQSPVGGAPDNSTSTARAAHRRERKFSFSQPLFQGFKSVGALLGAGSLKGQRKEEYDLAKEDLFLEAAQAFYALLSAEKNLAILDESKKLFEERIRDLSEREKIGRSRPGEVAMARAKMKVLEARIAKARGTLLSAQSLAWFYSGVSRMKADDEDPETFSETLDIDPDHYSEIAENRSDVAAARNAMNTAKQTIVVKQSAIWPQINLSANQYEKREGFQDGISWDALITMNVPLYRGGDNLGQVLEAQALYRKTQWNYRLVQKMAMLEIEQTHQDWIASREQHRAYQAAVEASQENFNYQKEDYSKNLVSNLDVLAALEELLTIREEANATLYAMKSNYWRLQIAASSKVPDWADPSGKKK
ncbi:MAG TPA: hypothetical protein DIS66_01695 [Candidatus Omnitrophica bacterium]|nr:hypothetical protein [Candidatus Omnitrophota bacterium]